MKNKIGIFVFTTVIFSHSFAGMLAIENIESGKDVICTVDGYTKSTGSSNWFINPGYYNINTCPNGGGGTDCPFFVAQNYNRQPPVINWVTCNGTTLNNLNITPDGPNTTVVYSSSGFQLCSAMLNPVGQKCF